MADPKISKAIKTLFILIVEIGLDYEAIFAFQFIYIGLSYQKINIFGDSKVSRRPNLDIYFQKANNFNI